MARAVGVAGMPDIRSMAILEDLTYANDPCAAGSTHARRTRYYGSEFFKDLPENSDPRNPNKFDRRKDWIHCLAVAFICFVILGILHSIALLHPHAQQSYKMGNLEVTVISTCTYAIVIGFGPLAGNLVRFMGHRLTCIFGLLMFFTGLALDALELNIFLYYVSHLVLIGFGCSFALTAAASSVVRHFRQKLGRAMAIVITAAPIGTVFFHVLLYIFASSTTMSYKWMVLLISFLVLLCIALTHVLPSSGRPARHPNPFTVKKRSNLVRQCIGEVTREVGKESNNQQNNSSNSKSPQHEDDDENRQSCLCVCVLDVSALTDLSFLLWAIVSSCAVIAIYVPYMFLLWYTNVDFNISVLDGIYLIIWYCSASLVARLYVLLAGNHTFLFNRSLFQVACIGTGCMYFFLMIATSYGWLTLWSLATGFFEGLLAGTIPRITLLTIPRKYMKCCWTYIVIFNGLALILGPYLIVAVNLMTGGDIDLACIAIAIIQVTGGFMAFFLPNEEYYEEEEEPEETDELKTENEFGDQPSTLSPREDRSFSGFSATTSTLPASIAGLAFNSGGNMNTGRFTVGMGGSILHRMPNMRCCIPRPVDTDYICDCPICSKIGFELPVGPVTTESGQFEFSPEENQ